MNDHPACFRGVCHWLWCVWTMTLSFVCVFGKIEVFGLCVRWYCNCSFGLFVCSVILCFVGLLMCSVRLRALIWFVLGEIAVFDCCVWWDCGFGFGEIAVFGLFVFGDIFGLCLVRLRFMFGEIAVWWVRFGVRLCLVRLRFLVCLCLVRLGFGECGLGFVCVWWDCGFWFVYVWWDWGLVSAVWGSFVFGVCWLCLPRCRSKRSWW